jgi:hypothetical protein
MLEIFEGMAAFVHPLRIQHLLMRFLAPRCRYDISATGPQIDAVDAAPQF